MLDNGYPLATESNILKELIKPPSIVRNVVSTITGDSQFEIFLRRACTCTSLFSPSPSLLSSHSVNSTLPTGQLSNVPWRRTGVYGNPNVTKISKSKLNCAIVQGYWTTANPTVQKYKGRGCCQLNCAKVQRSWMLQSQLCKSTKVVDAAISTVQKYKGRGCCQLNCAKVQRSCMLQSQLCNPTGILDNY